MEFRKLDPAEHENTRPVYEEVFPEDGEAFVDYYYKWKTRDSIIYVAEDPDGIHAMVHLNPFWLSVQGSIRKVHYIVAVATEKEYRHQGLMRRLLAMAERDMQEAGELFTFLMPASEQIYLPFGYRFFCNQKRGILSGRDKNGQRASAMGEGRIGCRPVTWPEYGELARFANRTLNAAYDVFVFRDEAYYQRLQEEQRCQNGEVMVICRREPEDGTEGSRRGLEKQIIGTFCTAMEHRADGDVMELREIILAPEYLEEARTALLAFAGKYKSCRVAGCTAELPLEQEQEAPLLMGKVPGGGDFSGGWARERVFINEIV